MRICPACGVSNQSAAFYCTSCGRTLMGTPVTRSTRPLALDWPLATPSARGAKFGHTMLGFEAPDPQADGSSVVASARRTKFARTIEGWEVPAPPVEKTEAPASVQIIVAVGESVPEESSSDDPHIEVGEGYLEPGETEEQPDLSQFFFYPEQLLAQAPEGDLERSQRRVAPRSTFRLGIAVVASVLLLLGGVLLWASHGTSERAADGSANRGEP
jgi:hypothetical protein